MRTNPVRSRLAAGQTVINGWLSSESRYAAEALSYAGFDCITVDLQHGMFGLDAAIGLLQAISAGPATPMARCPSMDPPVIGKLLDAGAYGIICPSIDTAQQAAAFVAACRYPPTGRRSFGPARGLLYGGSDYVARADDTVLTWAMIESTQAVANLADILAVPGLDGVYVGPNDLALSMGFTPGTSPTAPPVAAAMEHVRLTAASAGLAAGLFCADAEVAADMAARGWNLVTPGNDVAMLRQAAAERVAVVRGLSAGPTTARNGGGSGY